MKTLGTVLVLLILLPCSLLAAETVVCPLPHAAASWHPQSVGWAIGYMLIFVVIGIASAIIGYKVFDKCTPGDLNKEICENKNVAAAIIAAAVILGVCIIVAAAMIG